MSYLIGRYFECAEESDEFSSDEDFTPYSQEVDSYGLPQLVDDDDEVFIDPKADNDNASTDLLLEDSSSREEERTVSEVLDDIETDKQLQMEVAASTSAMFNLLLYHPFSCSIQ
ncbi:jg26444 [Pararge aegeria aegeria]|uniref:Jg26444 protein n=1 Tax=Pararge aegeria aegeria TaxID=348720 RepID=A0A8S4SFF5_9NEOP|nr:jg26444 [Pararge aegeria aegeria]